jgi:hypothetical protein
MKALRVAPIVELRGYSQKQVDALGARGEAFKNPDGSLSYPVATEADLARAVKAIGRGKKASHNAIRLWLIGRAKRMGPSAVKLLLDNWNRDTGALVG